MDLCLSFLQGLADWSSSTTLALRKEIAAANIGCNNSSGLAEPEVRIFCVVFQSRQKISFVVFILFKNITLNIPNQMQCIYTKVRLRTQDNIFSQPQIF